MSQTQFLTKQLPGNVIIGTVGFGSNNSGGVTTGQIGSYVTAPFAGTITAWDAAVNAGTFTIKFWKIASGTASPTAANAINTTGVGISTGTAIRSTTLTDFTTLAVAAGDIFGCAITAVSGAAIVSVQLEITKL